MKRALLSIIAVILLLSGCGYAGREGAEDIYFIAPGGVKEVL